MSRHQPRRQFGVGPQAGRGKPRGLTLARADDALAHRRRGLRPRRRSSRPEDIRGQGRHVDRQVQPIAQRPRKAAAIAGDLLRRAAAFARRIRREPARTRIHRPHQHEPRGEHRRARGAGDHDAAVLERLAKDLQHMTGELQHLVEEEDAVMGETDLAGTRLRAAANQRDVGDGVMRGAKGTIRQQTGASWKQSGNRMHRGHLERFVERERRQNARQPPRHHRLPRARWTDQQQIVTAGGCDLERAAREELAADVGEIRRVAQRRTRSWRGRRGTPRRGIVQGLHGVGQR